MAELIDHFRNLLVCVELGGETKGLDLTESQRATLRAQAKLADASAVLAVVEELIRLDGTLRLALSQRTLVETSLIRCTRAAKLVDLGKILAKIAALERAGGAAPAAPAPAAVPDPAPAPAAPAPSPAAPAPTPAPPPPPAARPVEAVKPWGTPPAAAPASEPPAPPPVRPSDPLAPEPAEERVVDARAVMESPQMAVATEVFPGARVSDIR